MLKETIREAIKPIIEEVYAEGYSKGSEDTARRMHEMLKYGEAKGYADGVADCGVVELDDIDEECMSMLVDDKVKELAGDGWTDPSKRLPERGQYVLATILWDNLHDDDNGGYLPDEHDVAFAYINKSDVWEITDAEGSFSYPVGDYHVVAWRPIPKPLERSAK